MYPTNGTGLTCSRASRMSLWTTASRGAACSHARSALPNQVRCSFHQARSTHCLGSTTSRCPLASGDDSLTSQFGATREQCYEQHHIGLDPQKRELLARDLLHVQALCLSSDAAKSGTAQACLCASQTQRNTVRRNTAGSRLRETDLVGH